MNPDHIITCVYCGQAYPEGTPTHGADVAVLTEHIAHCEKHPMRAVIIERDKLRAERDACSKQWNDMNFTIGKYQEETVALKNGLHDIFELASGQKSNRDCATVEGLINTAKAAVRVIRKVLDEKKEQSELHVMQLAGISTASIQNSESTVKDRITRENPYWTQAYADVCAAVDREMKHRQELEHISENLCGTKVEGDVTHDMVYAFVEGEIEKQADLKEEASRLYHELIYAVARVFPGETRHQTALRYITEAEKAAGNNPPADNG